jgi:succinyl-diaminopimelate desuccinylase
MASHDQNLQKVIRSVANLEGPLAKTISELIQFPSENPPVADHEIQSYLADSLRQAGLRVQLHRPRDQTVALTSSYGAHDSGGLVLYGHADVVPAGDRRGWKYPPYSGKIANGRVYGRGAGDMKAGLAAELYAFKLLAENEIQLFGSLKFVSVLDEEDWHKTATGWGTSDWLLKTGKLTGRACIMGEPTSLSAICVGEKGPFWARLTAVGQPGHGSMPVFEENACIRLFRCLDEIQSALNKDVRTPPVLRTVIKDSYAVLRGELARAGRETAGTGFDRILERYSMNLGVVTGGTMTNVIPEKCEAQLAFLVPPGGTSQRLKVKIEQILRKPKHRGITLEVPGETWREPTYTSPRSKVVTAVSDAARKILRRRLPLSVVPGDSDANVFRRHGIDTCHFGPGTLENIHGFNESVSVRDTLRTVRVYVQAVAGYFGVDAV